jgi:hypothetical protein
MLSAMRRVLAVILAIPTGLLAACAPSATEGGFESANPAARLYAIERAAEQDDQSAVPHLVEQLDADDPAVRFLAITALERLTDETFGYQYYDPPWQRQAAIDRWVRYVEQMSGSAGTHGAGPEHEADG